MAIPTEKAYEILSLPLGASKDAIEQSYKKLALKWHPEKYTTSKKTQDALKKFKMVNLAYRKLIHNNDRNERDITLHEMFEQYRQVFHSDNRKNKLQNGQTFQEVMKSSHDNGNLHHKSNTLLELNANNNYSTAKTSNSASKKQLLMLGNSNSNDENSENQHQMVRQQQQQQQQVDVNDPVVKQKIKSLAVKGNEHAKQGDFVKAIEKFTEALRYDTSDKRLFSNRSYCYDKISCFQEALMDAEKAIALEPTWPKGYFRKGRALYGLKMYKEAEESYEKVLEIDDINDPELEEELFKTRSIQLQEMGFSKAQSELAIRNNGTVQAALEAILMYSDTVADKSNESCSDMDNNELDYNENDSENGEESLSALLNKKLQPTNLSKQLLKQQAAASASALASGGTKSGSTSPITSSSDASSSTSSMVTLNQPTTTTTTTTTTTSTAPSAPSYLTTLLSNPRSTPQSPLAAQRSVAAATRPGKSQSPPTPSSHSNINNTNQSSSSSISSGSGNAATTSLWVGNVDSSVTEETLIELFSAYGNLTNVRCLPDKYCAFINYKTKDEAGRAMAALQGKPLEGQRLLIKYPDNPNTFVINNIIKSGNKLVIDKKFEHKPIVLSSASKKAATATTVTSSPKQQSSSSQQQQQQQQQLMDQDKPSGPVNGNECYFWRTTGCLYADKCRYEHIKKNKGIDKKPWHKQ